MKNQNNKAKAAQHKRQLQDTNKTRLSKYLISLPKFPNVIEHRIIAQRFNVSNYKGIFRQEAIRLILEKTEIKPKTASTLSYETGINQKYICRLKSQLVNKNLLFVAFLDQCPITLSKDVQFLSSDLKYLTTLKAPTNESN